VKYVVYDRSSEDTEEQFAAGPFATYGEAQDYGNRNMQFFMVLALEEVVPERAYVGHLTISRNIDVKFNAAINLAYRDLQQAALDAAVEQGVIDTTTDSVAWPYVEVDRDE
jgi:hypothetical protein